MGVITWAWVVALAAKLSGTWLAEGRWLRESDVSAWAAESRLNLLRAFPDHTAEPAAQAASERFLTHVRAAIERLSRWTVGTVDPQKT
jgi:hypothetical protein